MGHLAIACAANRQLKPQRVLFMPSGQSPHKLDRQTTSADHRYNMTALGVCGFPAFDISRIEIDRPWPSYTIDTARTLKAICPTGAKISFLVGDDVFMNILSWKDAGELLQCCDIITVPRPGYENNLVAGRSIAEFTAYLTATYSARIHRLDAPPLDISSTNIRDRFKAGNSVQGLIPESVENYVRQHGLYETDSSISGKFCFESAKEELRVRLSPGRFAHTMGVVAEAVKLATHYGLDVEKARIAALLHDCAKEYSADKKRALCKLWDIQLDAVLEADIELTHSLLGAESARRDFNVRDPEILQAIRYHSTGHAGMEMLDKIVSVADHTEPARPSSSPVSEMRQIAPTDINKALAMHMHSIIKEETQAGRPIHPWTKDALNELIGELR